MFAGRLHISGAARCVKRAQCQCVTVNPRDSSLKCSRCLSRQELNSAQTSLRYLEMPQSPLNFINCIN